MSQTSEAQLQLMMNTLPVMLWTASPDKKRTFFNQEWLAFTQRSLAQEVEDGWMADLHPEELSAYLDFYEHISVTKQPYEKEYRLRRHDSKYRWILERARPHFESDGAFLGYIGVCIDITERKLAEETLHISEMRFRQLADAMPQIVWVCDRIGTLSYINAQWLAYSGMTLDESTSGGMSLAVHPDDLMLRRAQWESSLTGGTPYEAEVRLRRHDGSYRWFLERAVSFRAADGTVQQWFGVSTDITERKHAEAALRQSEARYRELANAMPQIVYTTRPDGFTDFINQQWYWYTGVSVEASLEFDWTNCIHSADREQAFARWMESVNTGEPYETEYRLRGKDGEYRWFLSRAVPIRDETSTFSAQGKIIKWIGHSIDIEERKQAEEALARYQLLSQRARDIILYVRRDGRIIEANEAALTAYGYDRETLLTKHINDLKVHDVPDQMKEEVQGILFETLHRRQDGTTFPVEVSSIGADIDGERVLMSIIRDISARKAAEVALRESEERFRATFEQAAVGVAQTTLEGHYLRVNQRLCEITGYSRDELLQKTFQEITHPNDLAADLVQSARMLSGEQLSYRIEKRFIRKDGTAIWTTVTASVGRNEVGTIEYGISVVEDVSAQKAAEARLIFLAELGSILASSLDYVVTLQHVADLMVPQLADWCAVDILCEDGSLELAAVAHVDPAKVASAHELRARYPVDIGAPQGLSNVIRTGVAEFYPELTEEIIRRSEPDDEELAIMRQVGFKSVIIAPLQARGQVLGGLTLVWSDSDRYYTEADVRFAVEIAQRAAMAVDNARLYQEVRQFNETLERRVVERTAELQRSYNELDQFVYIASHDLKAPLRAIDHLANWIAEDAIDVLPSNAKEHLSKLRERIRRLEQLLDDLLEYARAGRISTPSEPVEVATLVSEIIKHLAIPSGFIVRVVEPMPTLNVNRIHLATVFHNLIDNAIKHHHRPSVGHLYISSQAKGERGVEFMFTDDGPGIDAQFHARIFEVFQTLKPRDQAQGNGIGLAIVKKLVESNGGTIDIESSVGHGATFRFTWRQTP